MNVRLLLAAVPLALALPLAGCGAPAENTGVASADGAGTGTAAASPSASVSVDPREAGLKFAQCMREHGVDMEDPGPDGAIRIRVKGERAKIQEAQEACKHFMDAAVGDRAGKPDQKMLDQGVKFAQCMREHGIPMKDPGADGKMMIQIPQGIPEEKVKEAQEACKEFEPGGGPS
ncbi:hypothetical protein GCM10010156_34100 [Planobispora rosea]|uniref:Secreted protein n=1 Tax=Planobispora rosea TaxID=35762 RepID=A0A8J3S1U0_PLARO|nr:hypothetical protein [Planobispora rosea]GGS72411.1 hypothetical protein GCM10010156_34100 [Planobispora rosea]GIH85274.1 hypothetical protein Pro02_36820 [Planobispora rosea]